MYDQKEIQLVQFWLLYTITFTLHLLQKSKLQKLIW